MLNRSEIKTILTPTWGQSLLSAGLALILLILGNLDGIRAKFGPQEEVLSNTIRDTYLLNLSKLNVEPVNILVIVIFWSLIYLAVYAVFWFLSNLLIEARNEVVIETEFKNKGKALRRVSRIATQMILAGVLILFLLLSLQIGLPLWLNLFSSVLSNLTLTAVAYALAGLIGAASNIFVAWSLTQIVFAAD